MTKIAYTLALALIPTTLLLSSCSAGNTASDTASNAADSNNVDADTDATATTTNNSFTVPDKGLDLELAAINGNCAIINVANTTEQAHHISPDYFSATDKTGTTYAVDKQATSTVSHPVTNALLRVDDAYTITVCFDTDELVSPGTIIFDDWDDNTPVRELKF